MYTVWIYRGSAITKSVQVLPEAPRKELGHVVVQLAKFVLHPNSYIRERGYVYLPFKYIDIALIIRVKHLDELVRTCNTAVGRVMSWNAGIGLKIADHKTDILLISSRKRMEFINIAVGDQLITSKQAIKYLGLVIDNRLSLLPRDMLIYEIVWRGR